MARVTVEDCLENMDSRFELVLVASKRARQLARGHEANLEWDNDKPTVMALREIAEKMVTTAILDEPDTPLIDPEQLAADEAEAAAGVALSELEAEAEAK